MKEIADKVRAAAAELGEAIREANDAGLKVDVNFVNYVQIEGPPVFDVDVTITKEL